jgi:hypothetical protein
MGCGRQFRGFSLLWRSAQVRRVKRKPSRGHAFIIAATDGYGVEDCLAEGGECGRVVADAWCEAHGHGAAISFGLADDVTGAIAVSAAAEKPHGPYIIRCGD